MKEALVILFVIAVLLALTAVRYRRQIVGMIHIWRSLKSARDEIRGKTERDRGEPLPVGKLVNCAKCGTWVPEGRAISLRGRIYYCSSKCLESVTDKI